MYQLPTDHWIVLDTSVVRHTLRGCPVNGLDLDELRQRRGDRPVSLSSVAMVELLDDLRRGTVSISEWRALVPRLELLLDAEFPFIPNGRQLRAMLGFAADQPGISEDLRDAWTLLKGVRSTRDLSRTRVVTVNGGHRRLQPSQVHKALTEARDSWKQFFIEVTEVNGGPITKNDRAEVRAIITRNLQLEPHHHGRLDAVVAALTQRFFEYGRSNGYQPTQNDAMDFAHLFVTALPAAICIADKRFVNFVAQLGVPDVFVLSPRDLLAAL